MANVKQNISVLWIIVIISVLLAGYVLYIFRYSTTQNQPPAYVHKISKCPPSPDMSPPLDMEEVIPRAPIIIKGAFGNDGKFLVDESLRSDYFEKGDVIEICSKLVAKNKPVHALIFLSGGKYKSYWAPVMASWGIYEPGQDGTYRFSWDEKHTLSEIKESIRKDGQN